MTSTAARFPTARPRRLRRTDAWRALVRETALHLTDLVWPLFVVPGAGVRKAVGSMPGVHQLSIDEAVRECQAAWADGLRAVILFGLPEAKDAVGSGGYDPAGIVPRAIRAIKAALPELVVMADVCMCEYTDHGHCGVLKGDEVDNDQTLPLLARSGVAYADAGADVIAPSDMMDGRVAAIRQALDASGHQGVPIMSYAAKFASGYYGPFREAAESAPAFGDRRAYQMDPANAREALHEVALDLAEGADIVMVKPALAYLDVVARVRAASPVPVAAYNVSGEYAMVKAAAAQGWIDERRVVEETLLGIKRAGADLILTYHARELATWWRAEGRHSSQG